jgi:hypothetical protein
VTWDTSNWQLWNYGNNVPPVVGGPEAIVAQQFDMRANPVTGVISGKWTLGAYRKVSGTASGQTLAKTRLEQPLSRLQPTRYLPVLCAGYVVRGTRQTPARACRCVVQCQ